MRRIIVGMVSSVGFETLEASDGQNAIEVIEAALAGGPLDLVVADWNMPVMNGLELVRHLRSDERFNGVRIIMVTSETEIERVEQALTSGADEYLMKPFNQAALTDKLCMLDLIEPETVE